MTLIYRAIWTDTGGDAIAVLDREFAEWAVSKRVPVQCIPRRGNWIGADLRVEVRRGDAEVGAVLRASLSETDPLHRTWTTTATAMTEQHRATFWVDLECVDPANGFLELAAPRLVRQLLAASRSPLSGPLRLSSKPTVPSPARVNTMVRALLDPSRTLPMAVFSHDAVLNAPANYERAEAAAKTLAGIASIWLLSPESLTVFNDSTTSPRPKTSRASETTFYERFALCGLTAQASRRPRSPRRTGGKRQARPPKPSIGHEGHSPTSLSPNLRYVTSSASTATGRAQCGPRTRGKRSRRSTGMRPTCSLVAPTLGSTNGAMRPGNGLRERSP